MITKEARLYLQRVDPHLQASGQLTRQMHSHARRARLSS